MRFPKVLIAALVLGAFTMIACHHEPERNQGPAEKAGEKIDKGLGKLGEKMEEGGQKLQDKARGD
jgi:hypothetical protein